MLGKCRPDLADTALKEETLISVLYIQQRQIAVFLPISTLGIFQNDSYRGGQVFTAIDQRVDRAAKPWFPSRILSFSSPVTSEAQQQHVQDAGLLKGTYI